MRFGQEDLYTCKKALCHSSQGFEADLYPWMLPQKNMVFEIDRELSTEHNISHRHKLPINGECHVCYMQWPFGIV
jgi:hypothetical protein